MSTPGLSLTVLPDELAICRLGHDAPAPSWACGGGFISITRTADELSIVCSQAQVPEGITGSRGWRALKVEGPLDLSLTGILASLATPLGQASVPLFALSTYDTDYLLVGERDLRRAIQVLAQAGHQIREQGELIGRVHEEVASAP